MSIVRYAALLEAQPEGGFTVTFPDIPEAITDGRFSRRGFVSRR